MSDDKVDDDFGVCDRQTDLEGVREVAWPYSEVDETERAVSAGRYGTGTVLIPPFREYLAWQRFRKGLNFLLCGMWYVMCACASDRQGRKGLRLRVRGIGSQVWSWSHFWVPGLV